MLLKKASVIKKREDILLFLEQSLETNIHDKNISGRKTDYSFI